MSGIFKLKRYETNLDPQTKIGRPQQLYIGEQQRNLPGFNYSE